MPQYVAVEKTKAQATSSNYKICSLEFSYVASGRYNLTSLLGLVVNFPTFFTLSNNLAWQMTNSA